MVSARHEGPTPSAISPAFTNGFLIRGALLVVRETCLDPEMSITFGAGDSDGGECARGARHTIATIWSHTCVTSRLHPLLHALHTYRLAMTPSGLRLRNSAVRHHRRLILFGELTCPSNIVFTRHAFIDSYVILPKMFFYFILLVRESPTSGQVDTCLSDLLWDVPF